MYLGGGKKNNELIRIKKPPIIRRFFINIFVYFDQFPEVVVDALLFP